MPQRPRDALGSSSVETAADLRTFLAALEDQRSRTREWLYMRRQLAKGRAAARHVFVRMVLGMSVWPWIARDWARQAGVQEACAGFK